ncbi:hypothetical protein [Paenibacillus jilunlii]|uniref:hypothetical protein n=1 Tax=Paenibacillus jilunlii TaxID=682956 RepID=UPI0012F825DE|nr:hypothetical protein [Paenibacillus jilunlii]
MGLAMAGMQSLRCPELNFRLALPGEPIVTPSVIPSGKRVTILLVHPISPQVKWKKGN